VVSELVEQGTRNCQAAAGFAVMARHLAAEVLFDGRPRIREGSDRAAVFKPQDVFDRFIGPRRTPVGENVAADLAKGGLEKHEGVAVQRPTCRFTQLVDRAVKRIQSVVEIGE
jgi:hypothetical protein